MRHIRKSKKRKQTKKNTVERHFAARCMQRLGYVPDFNEIVCQIQMGKLEKYDRQSNRLTRWKWRDPVHGISCILPYDKERKQVVTILFEDIEILKKAGDSNDSENKLYTSTCSDHETEERDRETSAGE